MPRTVQLSASASVTLNNSGDGQVTLGPGIPGVTWIPETAQCIVSSDLDIPAFYLYLNTATQPNFQGASQAGNDDTASVSGVTLYTGMTLVGIWTGGTPLATATLVISGVQTVPGD